MGETGVNKLLGNEVDNIAHSTGKAAWDSINTHMWSSKSKNISNLTWHLALLSNVSGKKSSLRESNNIELTLEVLVGSNLLARFLSNGLKVVEDLSKRWDSYLDAVNLTLGISSSSDHSIELDVSWVDAGISKSMEHGSWNSISIWVDCEFSSLLILLHLIEWGLVVLAVLMHLVSLELGELVHVLVDEVHEWAAFVLRVKLVRHVVGAVGSWDTELLVVAFVMMMVVMVVMVMMVMTVVVVMLSFIVIGST